MATVPNKASVSASRPMNCIVIVCDTLRRDHCGPYHGGLPLSGVTHAQQPDWVVPTPNMDRLAERGVVFDQAWAGSTPCMPARRDIYTGRYEFLERGWGPLEDDDADLPRVISGSSNQSLAQQLREGRPVSYLVTDHFHLWERGAGNYHMGYSGFEFVRGHEADAWKTDPVEFEVPDGDTHKVERHFRNLAALPPEERAPFAERVFRSAAEWLDGNHTHDPFYLHIDCFDPHEPWDPPEDLLKMFDPRGYDVERWNSMVPYDEWERHMTPDQLRHVQARYAAQVVLTDKWLGHLLDKMDEHGLWESTVLIFTTDHGTYNGDRGRIGKLQTHHFASCSRLPFVIAHPEGPKGERREQLAQLVDIYPTVLGVLGIPCPEGIHGVDLVPAVMSPDAPTRSYAITGMYGRSVSLTDGRWMLHQTPVASNKPLYWYSHHAAKFIEYELGPVEEGRRAVVTASWPEPTWLTCLSEDPGETVNRAAIHPDKLAVMRGALREKLAELGAPPEQAVRLGL
jgi:arylsulfatase A-like enzyme